MLPLLLFMVIFAAAQAEVIYRAYRVVGGDLQVDLTEYDCITSCLKSAICLAVSFCSGTHTACYTSSCGNIRLKPADNCKTIILADALLPDSLPDPVHEWILTDYCGNKNTFSTGLLAGSTVAAYPTGYYPALSTRFGNAFAGLSLNYVFSDIHISLDGSFSVFFWFFLIDEATSFKSLRIVSQQTSEEVILEYNSQLKLSTNFATCNSPCLFESNSIDVASGQWHKMALISGINSIRIMLDDLTVLVVNLVQNFSPLTTTKALSVSLNFISGEKGASVYCFKVFNVSLSEADFHNVAMSCTRGKVQFAKTTCPATTLKFGNKYYYPQQLKMSMWEAFKTCDLQNQQLLKFDSQDEHNYLVTITESFWTSLYGFKNDANLTWLTDGSPLVKQPGITISYDDCCDGPPNCYLMHAGVLYDHGCASAWSPALCTCTEY